MILPLWLLLFGFGWLMRLRPLQAIVSRLRIVFFVVFAIMMTMETADKIFGIGDPTSPYHSHLVRDIFFSLLGAAILSGAIWYGKMLVDYARKAV